jgi:hypothetical protein
MFHESNGLFFVREPNGDVTIIKTVDGKEPSPHNVAFRQTVAEGPWVSVVLTMTAHSERPGDWHAFLKHHNCGVSTGGPKAGGGASGGLSNAAIVANDSGGRPRVSLSPNLPRVAHGIPNRLERLNAVGNSLVPQIAQLIGEAIMRCSASDAGAKP